MKDLVRRSISDGIEDIPKEYVFVGRQSALKDYGILFLGGLGISYVLGESVTLEKFESQGMDFFNWVGLPLGIGAIAYSSPNLSNNARGIFAGAAISIGYTLGRGISLFS